MHGIRLNKKQEEERRINAVKDVKNGMSIKDVAKKYNVSIFTIYKWLRREDLSAKPRKGSTKLKDINDYINEKHKLAPQEGLEDIRTAVFK